MKPPPQTNSKGGRPKKAAGTKTVKVSITFSAWAIEEARQYAEEKEVSLSSVANDALKNHLTAIIPTMKKAQPLRTVRPSTHDKTSSA